MLRMLVLATMVLPSHSDATRQNLPTALPNPNTSAAGQLRGNVLSIALDAKLAMWHPDSDSLPGVRIEAFAETGRRPQVPGPLVRVPRETEIRLSVRNSLERDTLTFHFPAGAADSLLIAPGKRRRLRVRATAPGTFLYRATTGTPLARLLGVGGLLAGAVVVDSAASAVPPRDRVFVILQPADSADPILGFGVETRSVFSINGRSWPHTERLSATVGDTLRWRVINASSTTHPMHLHGFYYRVDAFDGPLVALQGQGIPGRWVVTERMSRFSTMSMTWMPERAGNWLFHCHFQGHVLPHGPLEVAGPSGTVQRIGAPHHGGAHGDRSERGAGPHANHALTAMAGLVLGVEVRPRTGERIAEPVRGHRRLRLLALRDSGFPDSAPSMRFELDDPAAMGRTETTTSPPIYLTRGEPVSITVVNRLGEPTAVHWHGIELESYFDGVAGFAGFGRRLAPIIAPMDSFEARFTPPRAGTFIYHSHMDEPRHHRAGLMGALIVRDSSPRDTGEDLIFVIKSARTGRGAAAPLEVIGGAHGDTTVLRLGRRYRLRLIGMATGNPNAMVWLTARRDSSFANLTDTLVQQWRPVAKDGADLPGQARALRLARQIVSIGETFDFEFVPRRRGDLRIEVRGAANMPGGRLLARAPVRVE